MEMSFFVAGEPKPQPRAKAARIGGFVRMYTPYTKEAKDWRAAIIAAALEQETQFSGPLILRLRFVLPRPKSHYNAKGLKPTAPKFPIVRPDTDNLAKLVMDALSEAAVWPDDCVVCDTHIAKHYINPGGSPVGCHVEIAEFEETPQRPSGV